MNEGVISSHTNVVIPPFSLFLSLLPFNFPLTPSLFRSFFSPLSSLLFSYPLSFLSFPPPSSAPPFSFLLSLFSFLLSPFSFLALSFSLPSLLSLSLSSSYSIDSGKGDELSSSCESTIFESSQVCFCIKQVVNCFIILKWVGPVITISLIVFPAQLVLAEICPMRLASLYNI